MAMMVSPSHEKKRVKVYELKNNDWFDRGTGFCMGRTTNVRGKQYITRLLPHYLLVNDGFSFKNSRMAEG